jgi:hypothetical protein
VQTTCSLDANKRKRPKKKAFHQSNSTSKGKKKEPQTNDVSLSSIGLGKWNDEQIWRHELIGEHKGMESGAQMLLGLGSHACTKISQAGGFGS